MTWNTSPFNRSNMLVFSSSRARVEEIEGILLELLITRTTQLTTSLARDTPHRCVTLPTALCDRLVDVLMLVLVILT